uniref:Obg-like ATPase 1 n=3 Tax=Corethron hystrix TaxID=216773 RepID=A0A7S1BGY0_9STRA|mmetsp:Transcript_24984/g.57754  ORF Transcript_24984/g.57754 Transcript_24984/m.57754 type:complete len:422 (+) Transcript_24984:160-1425(+)
MHSLSRPLLAAMLASRYAVSAFVVDGGRKFGRATFTATRSAVLQQPRRTFRSGTVLHMGLKTAIVGLPNVGKSTLFNALTETQGAEAANYPFCTIEPNVGIVEVPDPRLEVLKKINESVKVIPSTLEFVDIAGLVKGAASGEGLGNKFLGNIRQCDAIVHVVRCFDDENVIHVDGSVDPVRDAEVINLELALADLAQAEKRLQKVVKDRKKDSDTEKRALEKVIAVLEADQPARNAELDEEEELEIKGLGLLTRKKMIYAANVADGDLAEGNEMVERLKETADKEGAAVVLVSAQVEAELVELEADDRNDFLESLGVTLEGCGLRKLVSEAYDILNLQTYFTSGPTETRAWTIGTGWKAPQAAGVIHTDFEKGFIRAETMSYQDLVDCGDEQTAKSKGLLRSEGKDYVVQEGDVILFRFNV